MASAFQKPKTREAAESTRDQLIHAAIRIFAQKGYEGASVKDICNEAKVNVSLVSYYFQGKDGLYEACLETFGTTRLQLTENLLRTPPVSLEDFGTRLKLWVSQNIEFSMKERDLVTIIHRDFAFEANQGREVFKILVLKIFARLHEFFESARKSGLIQKTTDTMLTASMFHGSLIHLIRYDRVGKETFGKTLEDPKYRDHVATQAVDNLINGIAHKLRKNYDISRSLD